MSRSNRLTRLMRSVAPPIPEAQEENHSRSLLGNKDQTMIVRRAVSALASEGHNDLSQDLSAVFAKNDGRMGWASKDGVVFAVQSFQPKLEPGVYSTGMRDGNPFLVSETPVADALLTLPDSKTSMMLEEFDKFWGLEQTFAEAGFLHKRGFFLVGAPGAGKTASVQLLSRALVEKFEGVVIYLENPTVAYACLRMIRTIEPTRRIVCVLEDLDSLIENYEEADYLSLFDGEKSIDHVVYIATTNYPEKIDKRFLDRPSRFDQVITVELPSFDDRLFYLKNRTVGIDEDTLKTWATATKDFGIAHLKEIIISVTCFGYTFEDTLKRLKNQKKILDSSKLTGKKEVGFDK